MPDATAGAARRHFKNIFGAAAMRFRARIQ